MRSRNRLSLRWKGAADGADQVFHLLATERPGRTGSLDIRLPGDRDRRHVIEISQDPVAGSDQHREQ